MSPSRTRAAGVLSQTAKVLLGVALACGSASAQTIAAGGRPPASSSSRPFEILDNSFLVEEAFNQESGIFQNIFSMMRVGHEWEAVFTQEWPLGSQSHQLSYSLPVSGSRGGSSGLGDVMIHYRFQALREEGGRPAFSPRASLILPTGSAAEGLGAGVAGLQINLPVSRQFNDWYLHGNGGFTWQPGVRSAARDEKVPLTSPHLGASAIYRLRPMLNLMLETTILWEESVGAIGATNRARIVTLSPGVRRGWNLADRQVVLGLAIPTTVVDGATDTGLFVYASYELPFHRR
ncbi:MAG: transporter [Vicinamibacterales bacterium]